MRSLGDFIEFLKIESFFCFGRLFCGKGFVLFYRVLEDKVKFGN